MEWRRSHLSFLTPDSRLRLMFKAQGIRTEGWQGVYGDPERWGGEGEPKEGRKPREPQLLLRPAPHVSLVGLLVPGSWGRKACP